MNAASGVAAASQPRTQPPAAARLSSSRAIASFYVLALAISWGWSFALVANGDVVRRGHGWPTHFPALWGPAIAAVVVTAAVAGRRALADLGARTVRWRMTPAWWAAALSPIAFLAIGLAVAALTRNMPSSDDLVLYSGWPAMGIAGAILAALVNGFGEEIGWRGFLLPSFQRRVGATRAALIVAGFWGLWHLPLFFLLATYRDFNAFTLVGFTIGIISGSFVLTWLYYGSGQSILAVAVWHACYNVAASTGMIAGIVSTLVIVQAVVLVRMDSRARRRGRASILGPPALTTP